MTNKNEELLKIEEARSAVLVQAYTQRPTRQSFIDHLLPIMTITERELIIAWDLMDYIDDNYGGIL